MATYNFTVRATDNAGAYSDRNFNLTVNNTIYDRFIAVGAGGLVRSPDAIVWTYEAGLSGNWVWFGNKWLVLDGTNVRTSLDGTNWTSQPIVILNAEGNEQLYRLDCAKYRNGRWIGFGLVYNIATTAFYAIELTSADGVNWTRERAGAPGSGVACDFELDATGNIVMSWKIGNTTTLYRRAASETAWTRLDVSQGNNSGVETGIVRNYNGVWMFDTGQTQISWTSVDGVNWVQRSVTGTSGLVGRLYVNGRVLALPFNAGFSTPYFSVTAGRTWAPTSTTYLPTSLGAGYPYKQPLVGGAGVILSHVNTSPTIYRSTDDGYTWTYFEVNSLIEKIFALHARDGLA